MGPPTLGKTSSWVEPGKDESSADKAGAAAPMARASVRDAADEEISPTFGDQPDGWNVTSMHIGENKHHKMRIDALSAGKSARDMLGNFALDLRPKENRISSFIEEKGKLASPRAITGAEKVTVPKEAVAEKDEEYDGPDLETQPDGWNVTSMNIGEDRHHKMRVQSLAKGKSAHDMLGNFAADAPLPALTKKISSFTGIGSDEPTPVGSKEMHPAGQSVRHEPDDHEPDVSTQPDGYNVTSMQIDATPGTTTWEAPEPGE